MGFKKICNIISIGEHRADEHAQDFTRLKGRVHRIHTDGSIPESNPLMNEETAMRSLFSLKNRNIQGMEIYPPLASADLH